LTIYLTAKGDAGTIHSGQFAPSGHVARFSEDLLQQGSVRTPVSTIFTGQNKYLGLQSKKQVNDDVSKPTTKKQHVYMSQLAMVVGRQSYLGCLLQVVEPQF